MKKIGVILFSFFYLFLSAGIIIHVHHCGGDINSIDLYSVNDTCCCGDQEFGGCCSNEVLIVQLKSDQSTTPVLSLNNEYQFDLLPVFKTNRDLLVKNNSPLKLNKEDNKGSLKKIPLWKYNCTFIYYG